LLVAGCFFMEILDGTIVTTAAPRIGDSLGVPSTAVSLVITAYLVTLAVLIPVSGWVAARWGGRSVFLTAIVLFTVASIGCASSQTLAELVAMRVLQGAGGAMMVPVGRLVILARTAKSELMAVMSFLVWPALIAPVFAPLVGGAITTYASWHWIFLINVPLGLVAFLAALRLIQSPPMPSPPPLDHLGVLLGGGGLACLTYTAHLLSQTSTDWTLTVAFAVATVVLLPAATLHLLGTDFPLVNLRTLRIETFAASMGGSAIFWLAVGAVPFLLPLLFQEVFGWSPIKSGAMVLVLFLGNVGIKPTTTFLYGRYGFRTILLVATLGLTATLVATAFLTASTPLYLIGVVILLGGVTRSIGLTGYNTLAFADVPSEEMRGANTLQATNQQLAGGLGVAVGAVLLRLGQALGFNLGGIGASPAFVVAFLSLAALALVAGVGAANIDPAAGDVLRTRHRRDQGR
jgi:EmrB/QacA subfamily drug resistance transporter